VKIVPNKKGLISPEELREIKDRLLGFTYSLGEFHGFISEPSHFQYTFSLVNLLEAKKPEDVLIGYRLGRTLILIFKLVDWLRLEKENPNLSKFIFIEKPKDYFSKAFDFGTNIFHRLTKPKDEIQKREIYKKRLAEWFDIKIK
jgi:hypothetical protein